jgi:hypothetical protein
MTSAAKRAANRALASSLAGEGASPALQAEAAVVAEAQVDLQRARTARADRHAQFAAALARQKQEDFTRGDRIRCSPADHAWHDQDGHPSAGRSDQGSRPPRSLRAPRLVAPPHGRATPGRPARRGSPARHRGPLGSRRRRLQACFFPGRRRLARRSLTSHSGRISSATGALALGGILLRAGLPHWPPCCWPFAKAGYPVLRISAPRTR